MAIPSLLFLLMRTSNISNDRTRAGWRYYGHCMFSDPFRLGSLYHIILFCIEKQPYLLITSTPALVFLVSPRLRLAILLGALKTSTDAHILCSSSLSKVSNYHSGRQVSLTSKTGTAPVGHNTGVECVQNESDYFEVIIAGQLPP